MAMFSFMFCVVNKIKHLSKKTPQKINKKTPQMGKKSLYNIWELLCLLCQQTGDESEIYQTQDVVIIPPLTLDVCNPI